MLWDLCPDQHLEQSITNRTKMATATMAMASGMWRKPSGGAQDAVFTTMQQTGQEVRAHSGSSSGSAENVKLTTMQQPTGQEVRSHSGNSSGSGENVIYRLNDETATNLPGGRLPGLSEVPLRRGGGGGGGKGRQRRSRSWQEKKTDSEFDMVIVPSDGCYMSGSDSDDSDWSVGWFEPHPAEFSGNEGEESFGVLVPSYNLSASEFSNMSTGQTEERDSQTPSWTTLLANISSHTTPESQKQLDDWLASLTSTS